MREANLLDNIELMLYPKVTDHIVKILALKYVGTSIHTAVRWGQSRIKLNDESLLFQF